MSGIIGTTRDISEAGILVESNAIRNAAGIPSSQTYGPRVAYGLTDASVLVADEAGTYNGETAIANASDSGSGSESDPYVFTGKEYDNSEGIGQCLYFQGSDAIFIEVKNNTFSGYLNGGVRTNATNMTITVKNNEFDYDAVSPPANANTNASPYVQALGGDATINLVANKCTKGGRAFARLSSSYSGDIVITDNYCSDEDGAWTGVSTSLLEMSTTSSATTTVRYNSLYGVVNSSIQYGVYVPDSANTFQTFDVTNNDFNGVGDSSYGSALATVSATNIAHTGNFQYNKCRNCVKNSINIVTCDGVTILNNDFDDSAVDFKHVVINGTDAAKTVTNVEIAYNKLAASVGSTSEPIYCVAPLNTEIHHNWVTEASDDAYELQKPRSGCSVHDNVGDNVVGQVVDLYQDHATPAGVEVYNIYGDGGIGVESLDRANTGVVDTIHSIFVDTSAGTSPIVLIAHVVTATANVKVMSPIWPASKSGAAVNVGVSGTVGTGNTFNGVTLS